MHNLDVVDAGQHRGRHGQRHETTVRAIAMGRTLDDMYWQDVGVGFTAWLDEIANVLDEGRDVRHGFSRLGGLQATSRAAQELTATRSTLGTDDPALRVHRLVILWGVVAADLLGGLASLCRGRSVLFSLFPQVRGVVEHSVRIVLLLDSDPDVDPRRRCARAVLEELLSAEEAVKAASRLGGRGSEAHKVTRAELKELREVVVPLVAGVQAANAVVEGKPSDWTIAGEKLASPTDAVTRFGERWGSSGREWTGTYDALSAYSHPTLLGMDFYDEAKGQPVLSTDAETVDRIMRFAVVPYYQALRHHLAFNGWQSAAFDEWEASLKIVFPGVVM